MSNRGALLNRPLAEHHKQAKKNHPIHMLSKDKEIRLNILALSLQLKEPKNNKTNSLPQHISIFTKTKTSEFNKEKLMQILRADLISPKIPKSLFRRKFATEH